MARKVNTVKSSPKSQPILGIILINGQRIAYEIGKKVDEDQVNERTVTDIDEDSQNFYIRIAFKTDDMNLVIQKSQILGWDWVSKRG